MDLSMQGAIKALVILDSFEKYWAYYCTSDGAVYHDQCIETAGELAHAYGALYGFTGVSDIPQDKALNLYTHDEFMAVLKRWAISKGNWPDKNADLSMFLVWEMCNKFRGRLLSTLGCTGIIKSSFTSAQMNLQPRLVRLKPHLPEQFRSMPDPDKLIEALSEQTTIAVFGDIRRSQELMLYSESPDVFFSNMKTLIGGIRDLISQYGGMFDKFTGDGFLGYFCPGLARYGKHLDYLKNFIAFVKDLHAFAAKHFATWEKQVRKVPAQGYGLALGADVGRITMDDSQAHLICVGDSIVWAARMCTAAEARETLVNNKLYQLLSSESCISFQTVSDKTKAGETFTAHKLIIA
jgi:class 3 adenylate cyclase